MYWTCALIHTFLFPLKKIFNTFSEKGCFPIQLKKAKVTPVFKKKDEIKIKTSLPSKCSFPNFQVINCLRSNESLFRIHVFTSFNQISKEPINMIKDRNMLLIRARRLVLYSWIYQKRLISLITIYYLPN